MKNNKVLKLVYCGLFTALVVIATAVLQISYGKGYVNLGDGVIFASAAVLGPLAAVVGGVGSALADWLAGYSIYIPATLVIKAMMGLLTAKLIADAGKFSLKNVLVYALAEVVMVGGYFVYESIMYGLPTAALSLLPNAIQGIFGIVIGTLLAPITRRVSAPQR
jgi:uncharacterized membrane protein